MDLEGSVEGGSLGVEESWILSSVDKTVADGDGELVEVEVEVVAVVELVSEGGSELKTCLTASFFV